MAFLNEAFDATTVEPSTGSASYPLIPAGKYQAEIIQSEIRPTKNGDGQLVWLEFGINDGEYAGFKFETRLNIVNANPQAVEIAKRDLSAICHAVGVMNVSDTEQLHFKPMLVTLKVQPAKPYVDRSGIEQPGTARNEVGKYEALGGAPAQQPQTAPTPRPAPAAKTAAPAARPAAAPPAKPAPAGTTTPPWRRPTT